MPSSSLDDEARGLADVRAVRRRAGVERVVSVNWTPSTSTVPPLFGAGSFASVDALPPSQPLSSTMRDDGRAVLLRERDRVADVVAVAVRDGDDVGALRVALARRGSSGCR